MTRDRREYSKSYYQAHKEEMNAYMKDWYAANKEQRNAKMNAYQKSDLNVNGQTKGSIRMKSNYILRKSGIKIPGYEIHHCFGYEDPSKFIYCSIEMHRMIHQYLRDNNISADSEHYKYIEHLLDDSVVKYGFN